ncbi:unnamed protein product [Lactuca saligna]|uniref:Uncharacterized protein n=1 Tax=Lactuca saligna TaxID=75948 RepID=A0AA36EC51_LACSI|nr:unnamed protein product [Lactuca saligna]
MVAVIRTPLGMPNNCLWKCPLAGLNLGKATETWLKTLKKCHPSSRKADSIAVEEAKKPLITNSQSHAIRASPSQRRDYYYMSARSLAGSSTPPNRSYLWTTRSSPTSAMAMAIAADEYHDHSSEDESSLDIPAKTTSQPRPIPRSVGYGSFLATSLNFPSRTKGLIQVYAHRKLLQVFFSWYIHFSLQLYGKLMMDTDDKSPMLCWFIFYKG